MDREAFNRWLAREAERTRDRADLMLVVADMMARRRRERLVAMVEEHSAPPVAPEIEAFVKSTERRP